MPVVELGINSDSINYEVALESLGQSRQPLMEEMRHERMKPNPCQAYVDYCAARLAALDQLQSELETDDKEVIHKILNGGLFFPGVIAR
jgi:hypothetical protein